MNRKSQSSKYRETVWRACCLDCFGVPAPDGIVLCNLCHMIVAPGDDWHVSHVGAPKALGGVVVGVAHNHCNLEHGAAVVTPMVAKAKRQWRRHTGITRPGLGPHPMRFGRGSPVKKKLSGEIVARKSQSEQHRAAMAQRYGDFT